ncbi:MAG: sigma-54-dependent Fis family transcriptional regulator [Methylococcaceae bacterium]|nr:sigma-54-dependent Fis family transcriptional regulator [Methylococcaceae bacterium]
MNYFNTIIGQSPAFESLLRSAKIVAATDVTILIKGETGTGKEILATAIQKHSSRADKPFITLNCAALPEGLVESELFGHKKGAFTGANSNKQGILQSVDGGTLFLDEINSLPIGIQAKLLRFLETGECLAVGDTKPYYVNVRIVAATNTDLHEQIAAGNFRQDLFYRLHVVPLELPPLNQRTEDIDLLARHFMQRFSEDYNVPLATFSRSSLRLLRTHPWYGNIRELRNLCERLSILVAGRIIEPENLPLEFTNNGVSSSSFDTTSFTLPEVGLQLDAFEADMIHQALLRTDGNRSKSARLLGLSRDTLLYRIQKHGLASH